MLNISLLDTSSLLAFLPFAMIFIGASLQITTGVGLGLIAGPFLLFVMDAPSAIQTAILLNLLLTLIIFPLERKQVEISALKRLGFWACLGIPVGSILLLFLGGNSLKILCGAVILLSVAQLKLANPPTETIKAGRRIYWIGGIVSGLMTGALAIPGPVALWALLSTGLDPQRTRATLRAYFIIAYSLAFLVHYLFLGIESGVFEYTLKLSPSVLSGIVAGLILRRRLSAHVLRKLLELILLLMGASLLTKGIWTGYMV